MGGWVTNRPDVLSGQDVQQLGHVSRPLSQLHRELTDPVVQHQSSVHALSHQLQLHVSAAHHHGNPEAETGGTLVLSGAKWINVADGWCICQSVSTEKTQSTLRVYLK